MSDPGKADTVIQFEFTVDGMINDDGRSPIEAQQLVTDAIEEAARNAAERVGAHVTGVIWSIT